MSYRPTLAGSALAKMKGLPEEALDALVSRVADLAERPWDAGPTVPGRTDLRETTFGAFGFVFFVVDDAAEVITIYDLVWAG
ncbi:hypothetical protein AB0M95_30160 [Sphaerisporangium sp. NPDC051017]|uniref:hypothetical protein n=1 Tax=Sphaerisporangium sp. NPDC051017 TaxID=3154636 RepID=UPI003421A847